MDSVHHISFLSSLLWSMKQLPTGQQEAYDGFMKNDGALFSMSGERVTKLLLQIFVAWARISGYVDDLSNHC